MITLRDVIAEVESKGNQFAIRFEPVTWGQKRDPEKFAKIVARNGCSIETARMIFATSWGKYQIMGFNLYPATKYSVVEFLNDSAEQDRVFDGFIADKQLNYTVDELQNDKQKSLIFATKYNGAGNAQAYSKLIFQAINTLKARDENPKQP